MFILITTAATLYLKPDLGKPPHTLYPLLRLAYIRSDAVHIQCGVPSGVNCIVWHCAAILYVPLATASSNTIFLSHDTAQCCTVDLWDLNKFYTGGKTCEICLSTSKINGDQYNSTSVRDPAGGQMTQRSLFVFFHMEMLFMNVILKRALEIKPRRFWCKMQMRVNSSRV